MKHINEFLIFGTNFISMIRIIYNIPTLSTKNQWLDRTVQFLL